MLLVDLVKLFSTNFNINEEQFLDIIDSNNIKLSQRLLVKIRDEKKNSINTETINTTSNTDTINTETINTKTINTSSNTETSNNETSNKKTTSSTRGRGRPRKTKELLEESDVVIEVELVTIDDTEYYKTRENVIMTKDLTVEGILSGGRLLRTCAPM
jgi:hypothetical protein